MSNFNRNREPGRSTISTESVVYSDVSCGANMDLMKALVHINVIVGKSSITACKICDFDKGLQHWWVNYT